MKKAIVDGFLCLLFAFYNSDCTFTASTIFGRDTDFPVVRVVFHSVK